jgi:CRP/FNR family cyclic AMP-dependent transcriptional regulator
MLNADTKTGQSVFRILMTDPWFSGLDASLQKEIVQRSSIRNLPKGTVITAQGGCVRSDMLVVLKGRVRYFKVFADGSEQLFFVGGPGFWFLPLSLLLNIPSMVTVATDEATRVMVLPKESFDALSETDPRFNKALVRFFAGRFAALLSYVASAQLVSPEARLRGQIADLLEVQQIPTPGTGHSELNVSQADLANMMHMSRQTLSPLLKQLERKGLIELRFKNIRVLNPAHIRQDSGS